jgi:hypothetical protein
VILLLLAVFKRRITLLFVNTVVFTNSNVIIKTIQSIQNMKEEQDAAFAAYYESSRRVAAGRDQSCKLHVIRIFPLRPTAPYPNRESVASIDTNDTPQASTNFPETELAGLAGRGITI